MNDPNVRNITTLTSLIITNFPADSTGNTFFYQIEVFNYVLSSLSDTSSYILADIPSAPSTAPYDNPTQTSET